VTAHTAPGGTVRMSSCRPPGPVAGRPLTDGEGSPTSFFLGPAPPHPVGTAAKQLSALRIEGRPRGHEAGPLEGLPFCIHRPRPDPDTPPSSEPAFEHILLEGGTFHRRNNTSVKRHAPVLGGLNEGQNINREWQIAERRKCRNLKKGLKIFHSSRFQMR